VIRTGPYHTHCLQAKPIHLSQRRDTETGIYPFKELIGLRLCRPHKMTAQAARLRWKDRVCCEYHGQMNKDEQPTPEAFAALRARFQDQSRRAQAYYTVMHEARRVVGNDDAASA
jgi:hypothetical protein